LRVHVQPPLLALGGIKWAELKRRKNRKERKKIFIKRRVFVPGKLFQPSLMFTGKAVAYLIETLFKCYTLKKAPDLT
jgi:hypothetical protein